MKKLPVLFCVFTFFSFSSFGQTSTTRVFIQGGNEALRNFYKEIYQYPSFEDGIVEYKGGKKYRSKLNYNRALGTVQFLDEKGDTLALMNQEIIEKVVIDKNVYYFAPDCMLQVRGNNKMKCAKRETMKIADAQKNGAYGIPTNAGGIDSYDKTTSRLPSRLDIDESLLLKKTTAYYFASEDLNFVPATKKNVLALFPKSEEALKRYFRENSTDFHKEADLDKLATYLEGL